MLIIKILKLYKFFEAQKKLLYHILGKTYIVLKYVYCNLNNQCALFRQLPSLVS